MPRQGSALTVWNRRGDSWSGPGCDGDERGVPRGAGPSGRRRDADTRWVGPACSRVMSAVGRICRGREGGDAGGFDPLGPFNHDDARPASRGPSRACRGRRQRGGGRRPVKGRRGRRRRGHRIVWMMTNVRRRPFGRVHAAGDAADQTSYRQIAVEAARQFFRMRPGRRRSRWCVLAGARTSRVAGWASP